MQFLEVHQPRVYQTSLIICNLHPPSQVCDPYCMNAIDSLCESLDQHMANEELHAHCTPAVAPNLEFP